MKVCTFSTIGVIVPLTGVQLHGNRIFVIKSKNHNNTVECMARSLYLICHTIVAFLPFKTKLIPYFP